MQELEKNQYKYRDLKLLLENRKKNNSYYNLEDSFNKNLLFQQSLILIKRYIKIVIISLVNLLCFIFGLRGIYWLSVLLIKCKTIDNII